MRNVPVFAALIFTLAVFGLVIWWQFSLWDECRATNSFFYCLRVLSK